MKSQTSTQILYDDPNSFLRASKRVALYEMQGSKLKTTKPFIEDVKLGMETSSRIIAFINDLDAVDTRFKFISTNLTDVQFHAISIETTARELLKYVGLCKASLRVLKKSTTIQQEDLQKVYSITESLYTTLDEIQNEISIGEVDDILIQSATFQKMLNEVDILVKSIIQFINIKNQDTGLNLNIEPALPDLQPEEFVGGSHFKVLSSRMRDIQKNPYKRFI
jgi:hypothetical protein